jgi:hypothetical protein
MDAWRDEKSEEKGDEKGRKEIRKRFRDMEEIEAIEWQRHWRESQSIRRAYL